MKKIINRSDFWFILILGLTPLIWFLGKESNIFINGLDTNFPLDPVIWLKRRFFVWDSSINAGRDFSSSTAGLLFHLLQTIPYSLGFSLKLTEIINLIFWFTTITLSAYLFALSILKESKMARVIFVVLYSFNIYLYNTWENIKVANLALVASFPLFLALINFYLEAKITWPRFFLFCLFSSILASGSGINPAYFLALVAGIFIYSLFLLLSKPANKKLILRGVGGILINLFSVNAFWILPLFLFLFYSQRAGSLENLGLNNWIDSLSENTSILNILRLQGAWDWYPKDEAGFPLFIPYALNYFNRRPFIIFSFLTPFLAFLSLVFQKRDKKSYYLSLAFLLLLGVFMGAGVHPPTGHLYRFLIEKVPFFSFFRSPWYIFTPYIILSTAALVALLYEKMSRRSYIFFGLALIFLLGQFLYSYPLFTGKIFRPGREDSFYVSFPDYVWKTKEFFSSGDEIPGRIIGYPDDDLESFEWGYRGTESILGLMLNREFVLPSFNIVNQDFKKIFSVFYTYLKRKEIDSATKIMSLLGADTLYVKNDAVSHAPKLSLLSNYFPEEVKIGEWNFYKTADEDNKKIFVPKSFYLNFLSPKEFAWAIPLLEKQVVLLNPQDTQAGKITDLIDSGNIILEARNINPSGSETLTQQKYIISLSRKGSYKIHVERRGFDASQITILINNQNPQDLKVEEQESFISFGPIKLAEGQYTLEVFYPETPDLVKISDYSQLTELPLLRNEDMPQDLKKTLVFKAGSEAKRIIIPVSNFNPFVSYLLSFNHKFFYGHSPIIDVVQLKRGAVLGVNAISGGTFDWDKRTLYFKPAEIESELSLVIRIPKGNIGDSSKSYFENLSIKRVYDNRVFIIEEERISPFTNFPKVTYKKISPVEYKLEIENSNKEPYFLVFLENYSPSWTLASREIDGRPIHFSVNNYANAWYVPADSEKQEITIYYQAQNFYYLGLAIVLSVIGLSFYLNVRRKNYAKNS